MIFNLNKRNTKYITIVIAIIFFAAIFVLCPINNSYSAEKAAATKKIADNQKKPVAAEGESQTKDKPEASKDTLYEYEKPTVEEESYVWLIFKTLIVLGALICGFYYFYKFVTKKTGMQIVGREVIKVLSILPVGPNKFLQVIDLAGRVMVIGVSDSNINLITEIQDKDEIDRIRLLSSKSTPVTTGGFQDYISKYISKFLNKESRSNLHGKEDVIYQDIETDRMSYLKRQRERLKRINGKDDEM